ncbi:ABC-type multidrug transport system ATPase subunit [Metabacillus niabensis]|uniref:ABC-type multidrug transport system ATPase subunit n=1 Tax=Metabacillus niabensis TaxID=324854 RepID=A0ABT9Z859_9BACI|nr:ABC-type multidrug transport system ATPase subunit [Metabacillus niabensis]
MENIIEVRRLAKLFANQQALKDVSFEVKKGEIFGFLGPSGSGKTTTIKILTAQLAQTDGEALVFGVPASKLKETAYRKKIGVLTDNTGLYERLTVYDNLKLYCDLYDVPHTRISEVLEMVNLSEAKKKSCIKAIEGNASACYFGKSFFT